MEFNEIITQLIIPFGSIGISIWFASSAKKDSEKAQETLIQINESMNSWVERIMSTSNEILEANPLIIDKKVKLEKIETIKSLVESLNKSIETTMNKPQGGAPGHTQEQLIKELMKSLNVMIDKFDK